MSEEQPPIEQPIEAAPVETYADTPVNDAAPPAEPEAAPVAEEQQPDVSVSDEQALPDARPDPQPYYNQLPPGSVMPQGHMQQSNYHPNYSGLSEEKSTTRLFVRPFPFDVQESELNEIFAPFGPMKEVKILNGFVFVEFEEADSAARAIEEVNGKTFADQPLEVVYSKLPQKRYRVTLRNLPEGSSWQDLKDLARENNLETTFSSVNTRDFDGTGALEFASEEILNEALEKLSNVEFRGSTITVERDDNPPPIRKSRGPHRGRGGYGRGNFRGRGGYGRGGYSRGGFGGNNFRGNYRGGYNSSRGSFGRGGYNSRGGYGRGGYQPRGGYGHRGDYNNGPRNDYGPPRNDYGPPRNDYGQQRNDYGPPRGGEYRMRDGPRERSPTRQ